MRGNQSHPLQSMPCETPPTRCVPATSAVAFNFLCHRPSCSRLLQLRLRQRMCRRRTRRTVSCEPAPPPRPAAAAAAPGGSPQRSPCTACATASGSSWPRYTALCSSQVLPARPAARPTARRRRPSCSQAARRRNVAPRSSNPARRPLAGQQRVLLARLGMLHPLMRKQQERRRRRATRPPT
jgi:hypothetical protein